MSSRKEPNPYEALCRRRNKMYTKKDEFVNRNLRSRPSLYELDRVPNPFVSHDETQNRKAFSSASRHQLERLPNPFLDDRQTHNKRALTSESKTELRLIPDLDGSGPASSCTSYATTVNSDMSGVPTTAPDIDSFENPLRVLAPTNVTLNRRACGADSLMDIHALPEQFARCDSLSSYAGGASQSSSLLSTPSSRYNYRHDWTPEMYSAPVINQTQYSYIDQGQLVVHRETVSESVLEAPDGSRCGIRTISSTWSTSYGSQPRTPGMEFENERDRRIIEQFENRAINNRLRSAQSLHELSRIPDMFTENNPHTPNNLCQMRRQSRLRDFSMQSLEDLSRVPPIVPDPNFSYQTPDRLVPAESFSAGPRYPSQYFMDNYNGNGN